MPYSRDNFLNFKAVKNTRMNKIINIKQYNEYRLFSKRTVTSNTTMPGCLNNYLNIKLFNSDNSERWFLKHD